MINYIKGDLFTTPDNIIAHGVNCQGVMGSGVAKVIRNKYPQAYQDYLDFCALRDPDYFLLGAVKSSHQPDGKIILNCFTQLDYGKDGKRYVSYDAIDDCMVYINEYLDPRTGNISMPKIGAGLGGGNWEVIESIIKYRLDKHTVNVYYME